MFKVNFIIFTRFFSLQNLKLIMYLIFNFSWSSNENYDLLLFLNHNLLWNIVDKGQLNIVGHLLMLNYILIFILIKGS